MIIPYPLYPLKKRARDDLSGILPYLPTTKSADRIFKITINIKKATQEKPIKLYRNPVFYALELQALMKKEGLTQAALSRKMGISRARLTQLLNVLKLPSKNINIIKSLGDKYLVRTITERKIRNIVR